MGIDIGNRNNTVSTGAQTLNSTWVQYSRDPYLNEDLPSFDGEILNPGRPAASDLSQLNGSMAKSCNMNSN